MYLLHELRERLRRWLGQGRLKNARVRRILLGGLFFALLTLILSNQMAPKRLDLKVDDLAPFDLIAPRDIENKIATERKREAAAAAIPVSRKVDPEVRAQAEREISAAFLDVRSVRDLPSQDEQTKVETLRGRLNLGNAVPREAYLALLKAGEGSLPVAQRDAVELVRSALAGPLRPEDVAEVRSRIDQEARPYTLVTEDALIKNFVKELAKSRLRTNLVDDLETTKRLKDEAAQAEQPVIIKKGECCIIEKNKRVTAEQLEMLRELGVVGTRADFRSLVGTALFSLVLVSLMALYLVRYRQDLLEKDSHLVLLGLIGLITLLLALLMKAFSDNDSLGPSAAYLMPIAFNSMLVTILMDPKVAMLQSALLALTAAMAIEVDQLNHALVMLVGAVVGAYSVSRVESRTDIYRAGLLIAGANVATILSLYLMQAFSLLELQLWVDAGLGAANGLIVSVLVTGALPLFENLFGIVTPLKLLELSNPNHPLLKKLLVEAPGSYHHTILVANLCEAGAEAIGADQVLSRVGAYYHDIGKAKRPYFFVENQFGGENPHDKLPPSLSALIITSHVKDGLEMAREAKLPQEIVDFIPEHHGTLLVSYFYHMATKNGQAEYVLEEDFRYEGPKPQRKETAICMLADGCEASVRAMRQKGPITIDQIEMQVKRIIEDRLAQGQLENCDLTLRDLDVIAKTFVKMLSSVHHARIDYPPEAIPGRLPAQTAPAAENSAAPAGAGQPARHEEEESGADLDEQRAGESHTDGSSGGDRPDGHRKDS